MGNVQSGVEGVPLSLLIAAAGASRADLVKAPPSLLASLAPGAANGGSDTGFEPSAHASEASALLASAAEVSDMMGAGVRDKSDDHAGLIKRLMESLAATLPPVPEAATQASARARTALLLHSISKRERLAGHVPPVRPRVVARDGDDSASLELQLQLLRYLADAALAHGSSSTMEATVRSLLEVSSSQKAGDLFPLWSPARLPAERALPATAVHPRRVYATGGTVHARDVYTASLPAPLRATPASATPTWTYSKSGSVVWGAIFSEPQALSSLCVWWGGAPPVELTVEVSTDAFPNSLDYGTHINTRLPGEPSDATEGAPEAGTLLMLTSSNAVAAQAACHALVCDTPATVGGEASHSTYAVPSQILPVNQTVRFDADGHEVPGAVSWRPVWTGQVASKLKAGASLRIPVAAALRGSCDTVTAVRLVMKASSSAGSPAVSMSAIQFFTPDVEGARAASPLDTLYQLQSYVHAVAAQQNHTSAHSASLQSGALCTSLSLAMASASQLAMIRHCCALLRLPTRLDTGHAVDASRLMREALPQWTAPLSRELASAEALAIEKLSNERLAAVKRYLSMCCTNVGGSGKSSEVNLVFDPAECMANSGGTMLNVTAEGRTVSTPTSTNSMAVTNMGFSTGVVRWVFRLVDDTENSECTCFGAVTKPISDRNYNSSSAYMYRAYNGQLYGAGSVSGNKEKIHPRDTVTVTFDAGEGTLSYMVNDKDIGVCFRGLAGKELFPAVGFYSSSRTVSIVSCTVLSGGAASTASAGDVLSAADQDKLATAAVAAMDAGGDATAAVAALAAAAATLATAASSSVPKAKPAPQKPVLAAEDDETAQRAAHEGMDMLTAMGFHWAAAAAALRATNDNLETAADRLLSGEFGDAGDEVDRRLRRYNAELEAYEKRLAEWEASEAERKLKEEEEAAAPPPPTAMQRQDSGTSKSTSLRNARPNTPLTAVGALLTLLQDLASAFTPGLLAKPKAPAAEAAGGASASASRKSSGKAGAGAGAAGAAGGDDVSDADAATMSLPPVTSQVNAMDLEEKWGVQAHADTLLELCSLLRHFMAILRLLRRQSGAAAAAAAAPGGSADSVSAASAPMTDVIVEIISILLRLVRANLHRLHVAHVDPAHVGLDTSSAAPTLAPLHAALEELMKSRDYPKRLQLEAVHTVDTGLDMLYSSPQLRADLLLALIEQQRGADAATSGSTNVQAELLSRCLRRFSTSSGVLSLLPPPSHQARRMSAQDVESQVSNIMSLIRALLDVLTAHACAAVSAAGSHSAAAAASVSAARAAATDSLQLHGAQLLEVFQWHLLSLVADEVSAANDAARAAAGGGASGSVANAIDLALTAPEKLDERVGGAAWVYSTSIARFAAPRVLREYCVAVCAAASQVLAAATPTLSRGAGSVGGASLLRSAEVIQHSVVGRLLPMLAAGLTHMGREPFIAAHMLPLLGVLLPKVDAFSAAVERARRAGMRQGEQLLAQQYLAMSKPVPGATATAASALSKLVAAQALVDNSGCLRAEHVHSLGSDSPSPRLLNGFITLGGVPVDAALWLRSPNTGSYKNGTVAGSGVCLLPVQLVVSLLVAGGQLTQEAADALPADMIASLRDVVCTFTLDGTLSDPTKRRLQGRVALTLPWFSMLNGATFTLAPSNCAADVAPPVASPPSPAPAPAAGGDETSLVGKAARSFFGTLKSLAGGKDSSEVAAARSPAASVTSTPTGQLSYASAVSGSLPPSTPCLFADVRTLPLFASGTLPDDSVAWFCLGGKEGVVDAACDVAALAVAAAGKSSGSAAAARSKASPLDAVALPADVGMCVLQQVRTPVSAAAVEEQQRAWERDFAARAASLLRGSTSGSVVGGSATPATGLQAPGLVEMVESERVRGTHWLPDLTAQLALLLGRVAGTMIAGPSVSYEEEEILPLLRSTLFVNGLGVTATDDASTCAAAASTRLPLQWAAALSSALNVDAKPVTRACAPAPASEAARQYAADAAWVAALAGDARGTRVLQSLCRITDGVGLKARLGTFPTIELPLLLALAKHTGMAGELRKYSDALEAEAAAASSGSAGTAPAAAGATAPPPSLLALWAQVRFVRNYLREQKESYKSAGGRLAEDASDGSESSADVRLQRKLRVHKPVDFNEFLVQLGERVQFLLRVEPAMDNSAELTGSGGSGSGASSLERVASGMGGADALLMRVRSGGSGMPPPTALVRQRTSDRDASAMAELQDRWAATLPGVSTAQMMMRQPSIMVAAAGADEAAGVATSAASMPPAGPPVPWGRLQSWSVVAPADVDDTGAAGLASAAGSDAADLREQLASRAEEAEHDQLLESSHTGMVLRLLRHYVKFGMGGPPAFLSRVMQWRQVRALARSFGFAALAHCLTACTHNKLALTPALLPLRSALFGSFERLTTASRGADAPADAQTLASNHAWLERHYYMEYVEACGSSAHAELLAAYKRLYAELSDALALAVRLRDVRTAGVLMWAWACDVRVADYSILRRTDIISALSHLSSVAQVAAEPSDDGHLSSVSDVPPGVDASLMAGAWKPWSLPAVRARLAQGTLAKRDVLAHIVAAPASMVTAQHRMESGARWLAAVAHIDAARLEEACVSLSTSAVVDLYSRFLYAAASDETGVRSMTWALPATHYASSAPPSWLKQLAAARVATVDAMGGHSALPTSVSLGNTFGDPCDPAHLLALDAARHAQLRERSRSNTKVPKHEHTLTAEPSRVASRYRCDSCATGVNRGGSLSWACVACDHDCCESCFAKRPGAEAWESSPLASVTFNMPGTTSPSTPLVRMSVCENAPLFDIDSHSSYLSVVPAAMARAHCASYFSLVRVPHGTGAANKSVKCVVLKVARPVLVYVAVPVTMTPEKVSNVYWLSNNFVATDMYAETDNRTRMRLYRSKRVFFPASLRNTMRTRVGADAVAEEWDTCTLQGLGRDLAQSYAVFVEELSTDDAVMLTAQLLSARGGAPDAVLPPVRPAYFLRTSAWALLRALTALLLAPPPNSVGGAEGLEVEEEKESVASPMSPGTSSVGGVLSPAAAPVPFITKLLGMLRHNFEDATRSLLAAQGGALPRGASPAVQVDAMQAEGIVYAVLQFFSVVSTLPLVRPVLASQAFITACMRAIAHGSPRIQRLSLRLLRSVASRLEPSMLDEAVHTVWPLQAVTAWQHIASVESDAGASGMLTRQPAFPGWLMDLIAAPAVAASAIGLHEYVEDEFGLPTYAPSTTWSGDVLRRARGVHQATLAASAEVGDAQGVRPFRAGDISLATASEAVALARTLLSLSGWRAVLQPLLHESIVDGAAGFAATLEAPEILPVPRALVRLFGALSIMGGFTEPLRVGSRVLTLNFFVGGADMPTALASSAIRPTMPDMEGVLISLPSGSDVAGVLLGGELGTSAVSIPVQQLVPVADVPATSNLLTFTPDVLAAWRTLVSVRVGGPLAFAAQRARVMAIAALQPAVRNVNTLAAVLSTDLLTKLYDSALQPAAAQFVTAPALQARLTALDARLLEVLPSAFAPAASNPLHVHTALAALAAQQRAAGGGGEHAGAASDSAETTEESAWLTSTPAAQRALVSSVARAAAVPAAHALRALHLFRGNEARALAFMDGARSVLSGQPGSLTACAGQWVGYTRLPAANRTDEVRFLRIQVTSTPTPTDAPCTTGCTYSACVYNVDAASIASADATTARSLAEAAFERSPVKGMPGSAVVHAFNSAPGSAYLASSITSVEQQFVLMVSGENHGTFTLHDDKVDGEMRLTHEALTALGVPPSQVAAYTAAMPCILELALTSLAVHGETYSDAALVSALDVKPSTSSSSSSGDSQLLLADADLLLKDDHTGGRSSSGPSSSSGTSASAAAAAANAPLDTTSGVLSDAPVLTCNPAGADPSAVDGALLVEISKGGLATTVGGLPFTSATLHGARLGVPVGRINAGGQVFVVVRCVDAETGLAEEVHAPLSSVNIVATLHGAAVAQRGANAAAALLLASHTTLTSLSVLAARCCVLTILSAAARLASADAMGGGSGGGASSASPSSAGVPRLTTATAGGSERLVQLMKLVSASELYTAAALAAAAAPAKSGRDSKAAGSRSLREALEEEAQELASDDSAAAAAAVSAEAALGALRDDRNLLLGIPALAVLRPVLRALLLEEQTQAAATASLSAALVEDCTRNFLWSLAAPASLTRRWVAPTILPAGAEFTGCLSIPRAMSLLITFDADCSLVREDDELQLASDPAFTDTLAVIRGSSSGGSFPPAPLPVEADRVWWRLRGGKATAVRNGGVLSLALTVRAASGAWQKEAHVLSPAAASLPWACNLLEFLLSRCAAVLKRGALHNQQMLDVLIAFLRSRSVEAPMMHRIVPLLSQLLLSPHMFATMPQLEGLAGIESAVQAAASSFASSTASSAKSVPVPPGLKEALELILARRSALAVWTVLQSSTSLPAHTTAPGSVALSSEARDNWAVLAAPTSAKALHALPLPRIVRLFQGAYPALSSLFVAADLVSGWLDVSEGTGARGHVKLSEWVAQYDDTKLEMTRIWAAQHGATLVGASVERAAALVADASVTFVDYVYHRLLLFVAQQAADGALPLAGDDAADAAALLSAATKYAAVWARLKNEESQHPAECVAEYAATDMLTLPCRVAPDASASATASPAAATTTQLGERVTLHVDGVPSASLPPVQAHARSLTSATIDALLDVSAGGASKLPLLSCSATTHVTPLSSYAGSVVLLPDFSTKAAAEVAFTVSLLAVSPLMLVLPLTAETSASAPADAGAAGASAALSTWEAFQESAREELTDVEVMLRLADGSKPTGAVTHVLSVSVATMATLQSYAAALAATPAPVTTPPVASPGGGVLTSPKRTRGGAAAAGAAAAALPVASRGKQVFAALPLRPAAWRVDGTRQLITQLHLIQELSATLHTGARPSDEIACSAWLDAVGTQRYVQSAHPCRAGEVLSGELIFDGASGVSILFDPRCATPPGVTLTLTAGGTTKLFSGASLAERRAERAKVGASSAVPDAQWPSAPLSLSGSRVRYHLALPAGTSVDAWGVAFTVTANVSASSSRLAILQDNLAEAQYATERMLTDWTPEMDADLSNLARNVCDTEVPRSSSSILPVPSLLTMPVHYVQLTSEAQTLRYSSLLGVPTTQLRLRFVYMRYLNTLLQGYLSYFNFGSQRTWSVGYHLRSLSHAIFSELKQGTLTAALSETEASASSSSITLSNFRAIESEVKGDTSPETSTCMFVQAYGQLRRQSGKIFCSMCDRSQNKVFGISFEGESGIDAGGVYREGISRIIDDLFSERFSLLVKCANARTRTKINTNSYVPNPTHTTALAYAMLEFCGRLMAMSLRTKAALSFAFPSIVWKGLLGERGAFQDLMAMDSTFADLLTDIRECDKSHMSATGSMMPAITSNDAFVERFGDLRFCIANAVGETVELLPGGADVKVTLVNRKRFCDAAERFRLHEFDTHIAAMRRGFANVVPIRALSLFTWQELEILVSGRPEIDIELLKRQTQYDGGYSADHEVIQSFWRVLTSFTHEERSMYVRFVWGRARLPPDGSAWTSKHKITKLSGKDKALPMAHTCFNTLDLPEYTSDERMRWGLTTGMLYGTGGILNG